MEEIIGKDFNTIVIVGNWNIPIFTPDWVHQNLFSSPDRDLEVEYPNQIIGASFRFTQHPLCFSIVNNRFQLCIIENTDAARLEAIEFVQKLLRMLVHTPITSTGINFRFKQDMVDDTLHANTLLPTDAIQPILSKVITEVYKYSDNVLLTYKKEIMPDAIIHDFNYNFATQNIQTLLGLIEEDDIINAWHNRTKVLLEIE